MIKNTRQLVEISILVAMAFVLDMTSNLYAGWFWVYGGSVSLSLVPIAVLGYRHGWKIGFLGGFAMGLLQLLFGAIIIHPIQVLFDYPLPFALLGLAGIWAHRVNKGSRAAYYIWLSTFVGSFFRFVSHTFSGYIFFGAGWLASALYNFPYVGASWVLSALALTILYRRYAKLFKPF